MPFSDEAIIRACVGRAEGGILVYGGAMENRPELVAVLSQGRTMAGNNASVLKKARDISGLASLCREESISFPETLFPGEEGRAAVDPDNPAGDPDWLKKRVASGGGLGITFYRGERLQSGEILQRRVPGRPVSVSFIAFEDGVLLLGYTEQLIGTSFLGGSGFKWCGNITPVPGEDGITAPFYAKAAEAAEIISNRLGLRGFNGIDMVLGPDGSVTVLEVNPRHSGSMELFKTGNDLFPLHLAACRGEKLGKSKFEPSEGGSYRAKGVVYAVQRCAAPDTLSWCEAGRRDVPWTGDVFGPGDPVCTVFSSAREETACLEGLAKEADKVFSELVVPCEGGKGRDGQKEEPLELRSHNGAKPGPDQGNAPGKDRRSL